ncbi:MAG: MCE family protein [Deltaproteobacteria bacterium]|nr:MCE family protein [Deltaproteobacteria bacterium]
MKRHFSTEAKVGAFVFVAILLLMYITLDVSQLGFNWGGTYKVYVVMDLAEGISRKTPVQIAGIPVGVVNRVELTKDQKARLEIELEKGVTIDKDASAEVRTRGVLGDTYIEITPSGQQRESIESGGTVSKVKPAPDFQQLARDMMLLSEDLKAITKSMREYSEGENSRAAKILENMETLSREWVKLTQSSSKNTEALIANLAAISADMRELSSYGREDMKEILQGMNQITTNLVEGKGNIGRVLKDESLYETGEEILQNVSDLTRTVRSFQTEIDYHLEYLGQAGEAKNYVNLKLATSPDKYFLFGIATDPSPPPSLSTETEVRTTDGVTSTILREKSEENTLRFNVQIAKRFKDLTVRGGLIESKGGVGLDYNKGPFQVSLETFRFGDNGPNLKAKGQLNITPTFYLMGGGDDLLNRFDGPDWFVGAGIRFTDDDLSALFGGASLLTR